MCKGMKVDGLFGLKWRWVEEVGRVGKSQVRQYQRTDQDLGAVAQDYNPSTLGGQSMWIT